MRPGVSFRAKEIRRWIDGVSGVPSEFDAGYRERQYVAASFPLFPFPGAGFDLPLCRKNSEYL